MNQDTDPILDACLEEILGSCRPPDLSQNVLREWNRRQEPAADSFPPATSLLPPPCQSPAVVVSVANQDNKSIQKRGDRAASGRRSFLPWLVSGTVAAIVFTTLGIVLVRERGEPAAMVPAAPGTFPIADPVAVSRDEPSVRSVPNRELPRDARSKETSSTQQPEDSVPALPAHSPQPLPDFAVQKSPPVESVIAAPPLPGPLSQDEVIARINSAIRKAWTENGLTPPEPISDETWRERVFLTLLERLPTTAEQARFARLKTIEQRQQLVHSLLNTDPYREEFSRQWSELLTEQFMPSDLLEEGSLANEEGMLQYFRRALLEAKPFDLVAHELLTATGSGKPGASDYNGAANFLLARWSGKGEQATADVSRLLLGRNLECLQCHNDFGDGSRRQGEFWEFNAFFRQLAIQRAAGSESARLTDVDFLGDDRQDGHHAIVFFEQPDGVLKGVYPSFARQPELLVPRSGLLAEVNRREWLSRCVTTSPEFRQNMTNRIWSFIFGNGVTPLDDMRVGTLVTGGLLREIADQFASHRFDPRLVVTWGVLSDAFNVPGIESSSGLAERDSQLFYRFVQRQSNSNLRVYPALVAADKNFGTSSANSATTARVENLPLSPGKNGKAIVDTSPRSPNSLYESVFGSANPAVRQLINHPRLSNQQKAEHLFHWILHRPPRRRELEVIERMLERAADRPESAWQALWSALQAAGSNP